MIAFDTDVLTDLLSGDPTYVARAVNYSPEDLAVPIAVVEEVLRWRLNTIRQADARKGSLRPSEAYAYFFDVVAGLQKYRLLRFNAEAEALVESWVVQKVKAGVMDMRIAATSIIAGAVLVSRNRKDFERIPNLRVEYWHKPQSSITTS